MFKKNFLVILILIFFTSCEYKPIYSSYNKSNYKIIVTELSGDKKLNKFLEDNYRKSKIFFINDGSIDDTKELTNKLLE